MEELVASVRKVAQIMNEIAAASHEQSSGIEQINRAITQMDTVVQMNASLVEEATAAATSMASQATGLAQSVAQFRVEDDGGGEPAGRGPSRRRQSRTALGTAVARASQADSRRPPRRRRSAAAEPDDWKEF